MVALQQELACVRQVLHQARASESELLGKLARTQKHAAALTREKDDLRVALQHAQQMVRGWWSAWSTTMVNHSQHHRNIGNASKHAAACRGVQAKQKECKLVPCCVWEPCGRASSSSTTTTRGALDNSCEHPGAAFWRVCARIIMFQQKTFSKLYHRRMLLQRLVLRTTPLADTIIEHSSKMLTTARLVQAPSAMHARTVSTARRAAQQPTVAYLHGPQRCYTPMKRWNNHRAVSCFQQPFMNEAGSYGLGQGRFARSIMKELMNEVGGICWIPDGLWWW